MLCQQNLLTSSKTCQASHSQETYGSKPRHCLHKAVHARLTKLSAKTHWLKHSSSLFASDILHILCIHPEKKMHVLDTYPCRSTVHVACFHSIPGPFMELTQPKATETAGLKLPPLMPPKALTRIPRISKASTHPKMQRTAVRKIMD